MRNRILFILAVFIGWVLMFAIQKLIFLGYHHTIMNDFSWTEYGLVVLNGLKLDFSVAGYLSALPLLITLVSVWYPSLFLKKILKTYFLIATILIGAIFCIDTPLYEYWRFKLDSSILFYLQSPTEAIASISTGELILYSLLFCIYTGLLYIFFLYILSFFKITPTKRRIVCTLDLLLIGAFIFVFIRGGITTSTANVGMVYFSDKQPLNHAAINPAFNFLHSCLHQQNFGKQYRFFPEEEAEKLVAPLLATSYTTTKNIKPILSSERPNILLILLESFSANTIEALGGTPDITPHFNQLSKEGILFSNMYANASRTDKGLAAVLSGYPAQPTTSIMKYPTKSQSLPSLAKKFKEVGYSTQMIYGGDITFANMQNYFYDSGYTTLVSDKNFPISSRLNKWGANDDITFKYVSEFIKKKEANESWFTTFLTLSSHEPFEVPFHKFDNPYLNSIAFTDSCLGNFINEIKQLPAWDNTLIILVADHGFRYPENLTEYEPARYHIPMLWLGGVIKEPCVIGITTSQIDISATLLNQVSISSSDFIFSKIIFNESIPKFAFYTFHNGFGLIESNEVSVYNNENDQILLNTSEKDSLQRIKKGKSLLQTLYTDLDRR